MGVQIAALSVEMPKSDAAAHEDVDGDVLHALGVQGGLELGAHETIAVPGIDEAEEMNAKHGHVEGDGDDDQTEQACHKVLG